MVLWPLNVERPQLLAFLIFTIYIQLYPLCCVSHVALNPHYPHARRSRIRFGLWGTNKPTVKCTDVELWATLYTDQEPWPWKSKGHFTHETESPCPLHFKHSHWWKRRSRSKFASRYAWGTNGVCDCKMDVKSTWIPTWHRMDLGHLDCFQKPSLGGRPNTKLRDHGTSERSQPLIYSVVSCVRIHMNRCSLK